MFTKLLSGAVALIATTSAAAISEAERQHVELEPAMGSLNKWDHMMATHINHKSTDPKTWIDSAK